MSIGRNWRRQLGEKEKFMGIESGLGNGVSLWSELRINIWPGSELQGGQIWDQHWAQSVVKVGNMETARENWEADEVCFLKC